MAKLPEHPRCPHCGSSDTERHWGDNLMQAGASFLGGFVNGYFLGGTASDETLSKGAENVVDAFSQKYTCNDCGNNFTLEQSTNDDFESNYSGASSLGSELWESDRSEIIEHSAFEMVIEEVFEIEDHGIVITGTISTGYIQRGEIINISGTEGPEYQAEVIGIEMFRKLLDRGEEGDSVGLLLTGVKKVDIEPGMVASHILHIHHPNLPKNDEGPTPKGLFMKGLMQQANRYSCKIPALSDDVVIKLAEKYGIDIREGFRIAQKYDAIERLDTRDKNTTTSTLKSRMPDNIKNEEIYLEEYRQCLSDGAISSAEIRLLKKLALSLGISEERARKLEASCKSIQLTDEEKQYLDEFKGCLEDGSEISASTRRLLNRLAFSLNLTKDQVNRLEKM